MIYEQSFLSIYSEAGVCDILVLLIFLTFPDFFDIFGTRKRPWSHNRGPTFRTIRALFWKKYADENKLAPLLSVYVRHKNEILMHLPYTALFLCLFPSSPSRYVIIHQLFIASNSASWMGKWRRPFTKFRRWKSWAVSKAPPPCGGRVYTTDSINFSR